MFIGTLIAFTVFVSFLIFVLPYFRTSPLINIDGLSSIINNLLEQNSISNYYSIFELSYFLLGFIGLIAALIVVSAKNPIHRIASLVIVFTVGSFIFMLLDFYFLGLTYIIVYVGAIAILFLFVIMMVHLPSGPDSSSIIENNMNFKNINDDVTKTKIMNVLTIIPIKNNNNNNNNFLNYNLNNIVTYSINNIDNNDNNNNFLNTNLSNSFSILNSSINRTVLHSSKKEIGLFLFIFTVLIVFISLIVIFNPLLNKILPMPLNLDIYSIITYYLNNTTHIYNYINTIWAIDYKTITDISSLAITIYSAYPLALILIGISLWVVMIGIIIICS